MDDNMNQNTAVTSINMGFVKLLFLDMFLFIFIEKTI